MNKIIFIIIFILTCGQSIGCSKYISVDFKMPYVYRIDMQQGNLVEQSMVKKLKLGISRKKVRFIMGTPLLLDPFHNNRWEYVYSFKSGEGARSQRRITVFFEDDKLTRLEGDIVPSRKNFSDIDNEDSEAVMNVLITKKREEKSLFGKLFGSEDEDN